MLRLILRRLGFACLTFFVSSVFIFLLVQLAPGHVARLVAERMAGATATTETIRQVDREFGLNRPLPVRYVHWIEDAAKGNLGVSLATGVPVTRDLSQRWRPTAILLGCSAVFVLVTGLALATLATWRQYGIVDRAMRMVSLLAVSLPKFFLAPVLLLLFALHVRLLPAAGESGVLSWLLPSIAMGFASAAMLALVVRVLLEGALSQPYVVTALSKGARRGSILFREAYPNVAVETATVFLTQVGFTLLPATIVVETIFSWNGLGSYFLAAARFRDFTVLQAVMLLFVVVVVVLNFIGDLVQALLDPRVRRAVQEHTA